MKRTLLLFFLLLQSGLLAQTPTPGSPAPNEIRTGAPSAKVSATPAPEAVKAPENPIHQELRDLRTKMQSAMNSGDIETLLTGVTDDVVFSTMNGDVVRGKDAIRAYFDKMMKGPDAIVKSVSTNFEADDLTLLYGGSLGDPEDTGIAFGHSNDTYELRDGGKFTVTPNWTATMIREPDGWKVGSFHYSVSMFDNPVLTKMKQSMLLAAGGGAVLGLGVGLLLGLLYGWRRKSKS